MERLGNGILTISNFFQPKLSILLQRNVVVECVYVGKSRDEMR